MSLLDEHTIFACTRIKLAVVAEDERDGGRRQALNLGHTVGHAIETSTRYCRYRHGEAVGLGLLAALRLSGQDTLRARVRELLRSHHLPVTLRGLASRMSLRLSPTTRSASARASRSSFSVPPGMCESVRVARG